MSDTEKSVCVCLYVLHLRDQLCKLVTDVHEVWRFLTCTKSKGVNIEHRPEAWNILLMFSIDFCSVSAPFPLKSGLVFLKSGLVFLQSGKSILNLVDPRSKIQDIHIHRYTVVEPPLQTGQPVLRLEIPCSDLRSHVQA